ncbi:MAG: hypothetical protein JSS51_04440 [Planctomycetes bacterium]|nr:hypothetical protein [Planctomycetota bacterium]
MDLAEAISEDLALMDGLEQLTVRDRAGRWQVLTEGVPSKLRTSEIAKSNGAYLADDIRLHVASKDFPQAPKPGDVVIRDSGQPMVVLEAGEATLRTRIPLVVRNATIRGATAATAELLRLSGEVDAAGAPVDQYIATGDTMVCQLQPNDVARSETDEDRFEPAATHTVFLLSLPVLEARDAFRIGGKLYRWTGTSDASRIDQLPSVQVEEVNG